MHTIKFLLQNSHYNRRSFFLRFFSHTKQSGITPSCRHNSNEIHRQSELIKDVQTIVTLRGMAFNVPNDFHQNIPSRYIQVMSVWLAENFPLHTGICNAHNLIIITMISTADSNYWKLFPIRKKMCLVFPVSACATCSSKTLPFAPNSLKLNGIKCTHERCIPVHTFGFTDLHITWWQWSPFIVAFSPRLFVNLPLLAN